MVLQSCWTNSLDPNNMKAGLTFYRSIKQGNLASKVISQARPNQHQCRSHTEAICTGIGLVSLTRLTRKAKTNMKKNWLAHYYVLLLSSNLYNHMWYQWLHAQGAKPSRTCVGPLFDCVHKTSGQSAYNPYNLIPIYDKVLCLQAYCMHILNMLEIFPFSLKLHGLNLVLILVIILSKEWCLSLPSRAW